jgi:hypothetical protein
VSYNIKEMVSDNKRVKFTHYKMDELWYETETGFKFPVPISDCGDATFPAEDKALLYMRYIRKHVKLLEEAQKETVNDLVNTSVNLPLSPRGYGDVS